MTVDPKLQHLINKIMLLHYSHSHNRKGATSGDERGDSCYTITADLVNPIMTQLCTQHREYQRRSVNQLKKDVYAAIDIYRHQQQSRQQQQQQQRERDREPKRRFHYDPNDNDDEDEYDRAALEHDRMVAATTARMMKATTTTSANTPAIATINSMTSNGSFNKEMNQSAQVTCHNGSGSNGNNNENKNGEPKMHVVVVDDTTTASPRITSQPDSNVTTEATNTAAVTETNVTEIEKSSTITSSSVSVPPLQKKKRRRLVGKDTNDGMQQQMSTAASFTIPVQRPTERYSDLGGLDNVIKTIQQLIEYPILRPEIFIHLGIDPPRGVLLRGPPGTGKTHLANAVAGQLGVPFFRVSAPELVAGVSGESESRIRSLFQAASDMAPSLIFIDEIDVIAPNRGSGSGGGESGRGMEKRMVAQLLTSMDALAPQNNQNQQAVLVLAATNRPDSLDPALRRPGRFDKEILLGVPDEEARIRILQTMTKGMRLEGISTTKIADAHVDTPIGTSDNSSSEIMSEINDVSDTMQHQSINKKVVFDYKVLARKTPGFVGADIRSLTKEAAVVAINRIFRDVLQDDSFHHDQESKTKAESGGATESLSIVSNIIPLSAEKLDPLYVTMDDFLAAIPLVQPSSQREGFATIPDVSWDDIGALQSIREELTISVLEPIRSPEKFKALGLHLPAGVLLYGPPGCGKTLLAKAIAHESGANFISVKGPELLDKYVGESERAVRLVFERARCSSPCIIFFDELDSIVPRRGSDHGGGGGSGVTERVVNQLLTEMDGLESRRSVFIIAATNRPELIDPAMLRPGRLDKLLYVPLPTPTERVSILRTLAAKVTLGNDVDLEVIGSSPKAEGYSGADLSALLREAGLAVLKEHMTAAARGVLAENMELCIHACHFDAAFRAVLPSVSKKDHARYNKIRDRMAHARSRSSESNDDEDTNSKDEEIPL